MRTTSHAGDNETLLRGILLCLVKKILEVRDSIQKDGSFLKVLISICSLLLLFYRTNVPLEKVGSSLNGMCLKHELS